jgi:hypothetical protein
MELYWANSNFYTKISVGIRVVHNNKTNNVVWPGPLGDVNVEGMG